MYLGISIAMFFEILEFLIDLFINCYLYIFKGKRSVKKKDKEEQRPVSSLSSVRPYLGYRSPVNKR